MQVSIRQASLADWQGLRSIRLRALQTDPAVFGSNYQKELGMTESEWKEWLSSDDTAIFLLYSQNELIGMTGIAVDRFDSAKKKSILWGSWLAPHVRGKGLSKQMYEQRIAWAKKHPTIEEIIVSHRESNVASKFANQKHGFVFTHSEDKTWPDNTNDKNVFYSLRVKG